AAADPQRHVEWCDEAEAAAAFVFPAAVIWIEWQPLTHLIEAAREIAAGNDAANGDRTRVCLLAGAWSWRPVSSYSGDVSWKRGSGSPPRPPLPSSPWRLALPSSFQGAAVRRCSAWHGHDRRRLRLSS